MKNIKVSVILPVYNAENYLRRCLDSIVNQTLKEIEIICVNDSSPDDSLSILNEYAARDSRIRVITQKNAGAGAARNNGMAHARGKYLSFLDSDDFFEPDMLELAYRKAEAVSADFVVYRSDQYHTDSDSFTPVPWTLRMKELPPYEPFNHRQMTMNIFRVFIGWAWDKLYLRSFVERHHLSFQEQRTSNDLLFVFSATALASRIAVIDKILAHQRQDARDSLSKTRERSWHCFYDALCALRSFLRNEGLYQELEKDFINYSLHFTLWNLRTLSEPTHTLLKEKLVKEWFRELGISDQAASYFQEKKDYQQYLEIMGLPPLPEEAY